jgi:hypothetical protein
VNKYLNTLTISTETPNPTYGQDVTITHAFDPTGPTGNIIYYVDGSATGTDTKYILMGSTETNPDTNNYFTESGGVISSASDVTVGFSKIG